MKACVNEDGVSRDPFDSNAVNGWVQAQGDENLLLANLAAVGRHSGDVLSQLRVLIRGRIREVPGLRTLTNQISGVTGLDEMNFEDRGFALREVAVVRSSLVRAEG